MTVLVFGDSITQGFWDMTGGWVARIRKHYDHIEQKTAGDTPTVFNLGVSGDVSDEVLERIENETKVRINDQEIAIVIAVGVNDSRIKSNGNASNTGTYIKNMTSIAKIAEKYTSRIMFVGLTPCVDERTNPVAWSETRYTNNRIQTFDTVLKNFCHDSGYKFVDILSAFSQKQKEKDLLPDGIHPNDEGHEFMAKLILPKLEECLT